MEIVPSPSAVEEPLAISGLPESISFGLPVEDSEALACVFFDEEEGGWSRRGLAKAAPEGGRLTCETSHLSLFAAMLQSALRTLGCTNFGLFSAEAMARLGKSDWALGSGAAVCWGWLLVLLAALAAAVRFDRCHAALWSPEFLLVVLGGSAMSDEQDAEQGVEHGAAAAVYCGGCGLCSTLCQWCAESGAVREALDDICSNFFAQFAELRTLLESLCEATELETGVASKSGRLCALAHKAMSHSIKVNARHIAGANLFLSDDSIAFLVDDEDLHDYLESAYESKTAADGEFRSMNVEEEGREQNHSGLVTRLASQQADFLERQRHKWVQLHHSVCQALLAHTHHYVDYNLPCVALRVFIHSNPLGAALQLDLFTSCTERLLLLVSETFGALALSAAFFEAGGISTRRMSASDGGDCGEDEDYGGDLATAVGAKAGRFFVLAMGSYLLAGVPVAVLNGLLGSSGLQKLDKRGSPRWRKWLKARKLQRFAFFLFGGGYCCLCSLYTLVFLANIEEDTEWAMTALFALLQDMVIFPLVTSIFMPALVALWLKMHRARGGDSLTLKKQLKESLVIKRGISLALPEDTAPRPPLVQMGSFLI